MPGKLVSVPFLSQNEDMGQYLTEYRSLKLIPNNSPLSASFRNGAQYQNYRSRYGKNNYANKLASNKSYGQNSNGYPYTVRSGMDGSNYNFGMPSSTNNEESSKNVGFQNYNFLPYGSMDSKYRQPNMLPTYYNTSSSSSDNNLSQPSELDQENFSTNNFHANATMAQFGYTLPASNTAELESSLGFSSSPGNSITKSVDYLSGTASLVKSTSANVGMLGNMAMEHTNSSVSSLAFGTSQSLNISSSVSASVDMQSPNTSSMPLGANLDSVANLGMAPLLSKGSSLGWAANNASTSSTSVGSSFAIWNNDMSVWS